MSKPSSSIASNILNHQLAEMKVTPFYSIQLGEIEVYHDNDECPLLNPADRDYLLSGTDGLSRCKLCRQLEDEEIERLLLDD